MVGRSVLVENKVGVVGERMKHKGVWLEWHPYLKLETSHAKTLMSW